MINFFYKSKYRVLLSFSVLLFSFFPKYLVVAEVMGSSSYRIQSDTVNVGGADSSSTNYNLRDTTGEVATGDSDSASYKLHAGFWQMQIPYLSISSPSDLVMTSIGGIEAEASEGTLSWNVTTDNVAGYTLSIASSTTPALKSAFDSFADYAPAGSDPDFDYTNPSSQSSFGFSPEGADVSSRFLDNGSICGTGSSETSSKCWDGLSTTPAVMAVSNTSNNPSGTITTARLRAEKGSDKIQTSGEYTVTIVVTAATL